LINQNDASRYASRGQARTAVLALKLAESTYLKERRGSEPLLLLDDLLSELDTTRRRQIMEHVTQYQQCIVTAAELDSVPNLFVSAANNLLVDNGKITPA
jgi:DNA replication and repair protein RecF